MSDFSDLLLRHDPERSQGATQLGLTQAEQKIRLVFPWIDPFAQDRTITACGRFFHVFDDRVMTRRNEIAPERLRFIPEIAELEFFIAHHAWVRRATGFILARK